MHLPAFGLFAATGLMVAIGLTQKTARYAQLNPDAVWNAGMTMVATAFVVSRVLLAVFNWRSFLQYPLLVLALPSLTSLGVLITSLGMLGYLRWRGLPLVLFLDATAPCAALLWTFLSVGRFMEGTRDGMPTQLFLGGRDGQALRVHPVELYAAISGAVLCPVLLLILKSRPGAGRTAGFGLALAGLPLYLIDLARLPSDLVSTAWIDPAQVLAIAMIAIGCVLVTGGRLRMAGKMEQAEPRSESPDAV